MKSKQIFGKKGGSKRINLEVVEKLKEMFLAGNIEKNQKLSAENMLRNCMLKIMKLNSIIFLHSNKLSHGYPGLINIIKGKQLKIIYKNIIYW